MVFPTRSNSDEINASWFNGLNAISDTTSDDFAIGDGTDTTKSITANNADVNKPKLRYNHTLNYWEFTNNGIDYTEIGSGGGGGLNSYNSFVADNDPYADWDTTWLANATFGEETTAPLDGDASYLLTNVTGSVNEFLYSPDVAVPLRARGKVNGIVFPYSYDGDDDDLTVQIYDNTNTVLLESALNIEASANGTISIGVHIPTSCESIKIKILVAVVNNGKKFIFDNILFSDSPFVYKNLLNITEFDDFTVTGTWTANTTYTGKYARTGDRAALDIGIALTGAPTSTTLTVDISALGTIDTTKLSDTLLTYLGEVQIRENGVQTVKGYVRLASSTTLAIMYLQTPVTNVVAGSVSQIAPFTFGTADKIHIKIADLPMVGWSAETEHVVSPRSGQKQYSEADGDFTVTGTNWTTGAAVAVPYKTQDGAWRMKFNIDGTLSSTTTSLTLTMSGVTNPAFSQALSLYLGEDGVNTRSPSLTLFTNGSSGQILLSADGGAAFDVVVVSGDVELASKPTWADDTTTNYLAAVPIQQTAYVKDVKTSGTAGGSSSAATVHTRDLTTVEGDVGIVSLSVNQFTLSPGVYEIEANCPNISGGQTQAYLYNTNDSTIDLEGESAYSGISTSAQINATLYGRVTITSAKTYEIRQYVDDARAGDGLGVETASRASNPCTTNIYTIVKITKVA